MNRIVAFILSVIAIGLVTNWMLETADQAPTRSTQNDPDVYMLGASIRQYDDAGRLQHHLEASRFTHFPLTKVTTLITPSILLATNQVWQITASEGRMLAPSAYREKTLELWNQVQAKRRDWLGDPGDSNALGETGDANALDGPDDSDALGDPGDANALDGPDDSDALDGPGDSNALGEPGDADDPNGRVRAKPSISIKTESMTIYPDRNYAETSAAVTIKDQAGTTHAAGMKAFLEQGRYILFSDEQAQMSTLLTADRVDDANLALRQPIHIAADTAVVDEPRGTTTYRGGVVITQGSLTLSAGEVDLLSGQDGITRLVARADRHSPLVRYEQLTTEGMTSAQARQITYQVREEELQLVGNARLQQLGDLFTGETLVYDMQQGLVNLTSSAPGSRAKMTINPRASNQDEEQ